MRTKKQIISPRSPRGILVTPGCPQTALERRIDPACQLSAARRCTGPKYSGRRRVSQPARKSRIIARAMKQIISSRFPRGLLVIPGRPQTACPPPPSRSDLDKYFTSVFRDPKAVHPPVDIPAAWAPEAVPGGPSLENEGSVAASPALAVHPAPPAAQPVLSASLGSASVAALAAQPAFRSVADAAAAPPRALALASSLDLGLDRRPACAGRSAYQARHRCRCR